MSREPGTNHGFGRTTAVQSADSPELRALLRQSPAGAVTTTQVLAIVSEPQFQSEILRRVTDRGQCTWPDPDSWSHRRLRQEPPPTAAQCAEPVRCHHPCGSIWVSERRTRSDTASSAHLIHRSDCAGCPACARRNTDREHCRPARITDPRGTKPPSNHGPSSAARKLCLVTWAVTAVTCTCH